VINIDWRSVSLIDFNGDTIIIPNSAIANDMLINYSRPAKIHRESVGFDISFDDAPNKVKQVLIEAAYDTQGILKEPTPQVALISYDEESIHYEIYYFIESYEDVAIIKNDFISRIWYANKRYGITFPIEANNDNKEIVENNNITEQIKEELQNLEIFTVDDKEILALATKCKVDEFGVGECLLHTGELTKNVYVIIEGVAIEHIENKNGEFLHQKRLKRGDMFGLASLVRKEPSLVTICALSDIKVITISINAMKEFLHKNPEVAQSVEMMVNIHEEKLKSSLFDIS